jgi:hypothetical protein
LRKQGGALLLFSLCFFFQSTVAIGSDYDFDISEFEVKPYEYGGFLSLEPSLTFLDEDSKSYQLRFFNDAPENPYPAGNLEAQLFGSYKISSVKFYARADSIITRTFDGPENNLVLQEGYLLSQKTPEAGFILGKKVLKWGKGYAFNPVAFLDRQKDPNDTELALEGFYLTQFEMIRSFSGDLSNIAFTLVAAPVIEKMNEELTPENTVGIAGKIYFLIYDTDLDIIIMATPNVGSKFGIDFSRNLSTNFEIHGEAAYLTQRAKAVINDLGGMDKTSDSAFLGLAGIRYLTGTDTTFIFEYFHNSAGYSKDEMQDFYRLAGQAYEVYQLSGSSQQLEMVNKLLQQGYGRPTPMTDYLFFRASQPEPFDIVYSSVAVTSLFNLSDNSFSLAPEIVYSGWSNFELRVRTIANVGTDDSDFGEKISDYRSDFRVRYSF